MNENEIITFEKESIIGNTFRDIESAEAVLEDIKDGKYTNSSTIYGLLQTIVTEWGDTYVGEAAKQIIKERFS